MSRTYLTKRNKKGLTSYSILLDNQSEISIFKCKHLVTNIRYTDKVIGIIGIKDTEPIIVNQIADTENFGTVYFSEQATANILSYHDIEKIMSINLIKNNKDVTIAFSAIHKENPGDTYLFKHRSNKLFSYEGFKIVNHARSYVLRVRDKMKKYKPDEIKRAERALLMRARMGYPNVQHFKKMLVAGTIQDINVSTKDVDIAEDIWGKYYADAAGKTGYKPTSIFEPDNIIDAVADHVNNMKNQPLTLHADIFFAGGLAFLLSVSKPLNYVIITYIKNRGWRTVLEALETHKNTYTKYGWNAKYLRFDRERGVSCIKQVLATKLDLHLENSASYQHVPVAERKIRLVKERMRCEIANLNYKMNTNFLLYLPKYCARRLNIHTINVIGINISPTEMLTGKRTNAKVELKIGFGEYAHVWHPIGESNNMEKRTTNGICLGLSNNKEGSAIFYDLSKPSKQTPLIVDNFTVAPLPDNIALQLDSLARQAPIDKEKKLKRQDVTLAQDILTPENILLPESEIAPESYTTTGVDAEQEKLVLVENPAPISDNIIEELKVNMYDENGEHIDKDISIDEIHESETTQAELRGGNVTHDNSDSNDVNHDNIHSNDDSNIGATAITNGYFDNIIDSNINN